jgi:hypothetical protein
MYKRTSKGPAWNSSIALKDQDFIDDKVRIELNKKEHA